MRNYKSAYVSEQDVINCFIIKNKNLRIRFIDVPDDTKVVRAGYDQYRSGFHVILEHESFDPIPEGEMIPSIIISYVIEAEVNHLETLVQDIVSQELDEICWIDVYQRLANAVGITFEPELLPREEFLNNCARFHDSLKSGDRYESR